jgi:hypothetical protein
MLFSWFEQKAAFPEDCGVSLFSFSMEEKVTSNAFGSALFANEQ